MSGGSSRDRRPERHAALAALLEAQGLDALLVTSRPNIRYLTGFSGSAGVVVATRGGGAPLLVTDFRYDEQAREQAGNVARVEIEGTSVWDRLFKELPTVSSATHGTIGYETHALSVKDAERLAGAAATAWRWKPAGELVERLRVRKDPGEVAAIRAAATLATTALRDTLAGGEVRPGLTELEIAGRLEGALRRHGSEAHPFPTIVASGPRSALPHAHTSARTVAAGEWLLLDFGAVVDGYCADVTRTVIVGARADESQRALYGLVRESQRRAREGVRAGMARDPIEAAGLGAAFGHSTGHGLGLEVHEAPRLARTAADPLPEGAVVTIEPGVYVAGRGGVRIEDDVHLSAHGPVLLTDGGADLVELV